MFSLLCLTWAMLFAVVVQADEYGNFGTATELDWWDVVSPDIPDVCDVGILKGMESRAWMEAEREIEQNKNLIYRPDSVLRYSCFTQSYGALASGGTFSSGDLRWEGATNYPGYSRYGMQIVMSDLVGNTYGSYSYNFESYFLGGRSSIRDYNCDKMNQVWHEAKCNDFDSVGYPYHNDGFSSFERYLDNNFRFDPRDYPSANLCSPNSARADNWTIAVDYSYGTPNWLNFVESGWDQDWHFNTKKSYVEALNVYDGGVDCSPSGTSEIASKPIGTGVMVQLVAVGGVTPDPYEEGVCVVPGCYYTPPSGGGEAKDGTCEAPD